MVKLEEVPDEEFEREQPGPINDEDDWDTDDGMYLHRRALDTDSFQTMLARYQTQSLRARHLETESQH